MKMTQSVALAPRGGASLSRENILLLLLKLRTFIALFLIVGFFTMTVPGFLSAGSMVIINTLRLTPFWRWGSPLSLSLPVSTFRLALRSVSAE